MAEKKGAKAGKEAAASPDDMMKPGDMRQVPGQAKRGAPAFCAIALTRDKEGVILLDEPKKSKRLAVDLKKTAGAIGLELDTTSLRFGRAVVDTDADASLLELTVNWDAPSTMRPKLLDTPLSDLLHGAAKAGSAEEDQRILTEVRRAVGQLQQFVQSHPVIDHLDGNPFHPVTIGKTLNASLAAVSNTVS